MTRRKKSNFMSFLWHISVFERQFPIVNWVSSSHRLCCMSCSSKRATTRSVCENWLRRLFVFRSPFDVFMQCSVHSLMCVIFKHSLHRQNVSLKAKCYFITIPSTWAYDKITACRSIFNEFSVWIHAVFGKGKGIRWKNNMKTNRQRENGERRRWNISQIHTHREKIRMHCIFICTVALHLIPFFKMSALHFVFLPGCRGNHGDWRYHITVSFLSYRNEYKNSLNQWFLSLGIIDEFAEGCLPYWKKKKH